MNPYVIIIINFLLIPAICGYFGYSRATLNEIILVYC